MKKFLTFLIVVAVVIFGLYSCGKRKINNTFINTVKDGYFEELSYDVTVGEILEAVCTDSKWEHDLTSKEGNGQMVVYTGNLNGNPIRLVFLIYNLGGMSFRLNSIGFNGESYAYGTNPQEVELFMYLLYKEYRAKTGKK